MGGRPPHSQLFAHVSPYFPQDTTSSRHLVEAVVPAGVPRCQHGALGRVQSVSHEAPGSTPRVVGTVLTGSRHPVPRQPPVPCLLLANLPPAVLGPLHWAVSLGSTHICTLTPLVAGMQRHQRATHRLHGCAYSRPSWSRAPSSPSNAALPFI